MAFASYVDALRPIVLDDPGIDLDRVVNVEDPLLDRLNVRFLMAEPGAGFGGRWKRVYAGPDGTLFENTAVRGRFFAVAGDATVVVRARSPLAFVVDVDARTPARIASSQPGRGWVVKSSAIGDVDATKGLVFNSFKVPKGRSTVEVVYRPMAFYGALPISLVAGLLLAFRKSWNSTLGRGVVRGPDAEPCSLKD
jgi:hypothetical protein